MVFLETICWAPAWCYMLSLHPFISISRLPYLGDPMIVLIFQMRKHTQRGLLTCRGSHSCPVAEQKLGTQGCLISEPVSLTL